MKDRLRHVVHVIPGLTASSGPTQALCELTREQVRLGWRVSVCHVTGRGADPATGLLDAQVERHECPAMLLRYWAYSPALARRVRALAREADIFHMHSLWLYPNTVVRRAARAANRPYLIRPAGSLEPWCFPRRSLHKRAYFALVESGVLANAAGIHAVSEQEALHIRACGVTTPVRVIPNGVTLPSGTDLIERAVARAQFGLPPEARVVLHLGRIHPKKGLDILGQAFRSVLAGVPDAWLLVVGPDRHAYAEALRAQYRTWGIAGRVRFVGERAGADKWAAIAACDVFALASHSENFGIAALEAMAAARPAIVSTAMPWEDAVEVGAALRLPPEPAAFASALSALLQDPHRRLAMGRAGRALAASTYAWPTIARTVLDWYMDCMTNRDCRAEGAPK